MWLPAFGSSFGYALHLIDGRRCPCGVFEHEAQTKRQMARQVERQRRLGNMFRYSDGRREWRTGVDEGARVWLVRDVPRGNELRGVERICHRVVFREQGHPDVIEYHEHGHEPALRSALESDALADLRQRRDSMFGEHEGL